ncbi:MULTISPECIES: hydrogenase large subunit [Dethiosulfovibrio]|uniref:Nickel-dependent hydrogenase large subunit n=2 Tax=Dethiosulfovibrio TaxID=47054 RepID=A0ABS9EL22_9BACT|nr:MULTISPECIES: nickel-dependent hydrogenase large subunit [Dethiosulfovibrio]MCF4113732.1 nickel-dependent hydrogenase large subunit [Dethiosulfovibrio russensis]MCF4141855.1 nickel-dependent hydrogenase large subunit [Dethiosulfovibrio marinus]MCF4143727.1 nickel-dependent hydrogenase large subunit [Dethiosulfovibrio acidaminovorans]MEA3284782.1 nickel-dependent hydrogenase large subunit [Synergistota bacterium]
MSETKTYKLPIGPVHVGLKEPITAWLDIEGEHIKDAVIRPGAIHRGVEFMARERNPIQVIYLAERVCGICSFSHAIAFVKAVEDAAQIEVPIRAQYIRSMVLELERIHSHILWSGVACYTIGFDSAFHLGMMLREKVMDVLEALSGNRVNYAVTTVGGVRWDVTPAVERTVMDMIHYYRNEFASFYEAAINDPVVRARLRDVGVLTTEQAIKYCALGPTSRGSGVRADVRWSAPYDAYCDIHVEPVVPQDYTGEVHGDVYDRFLVRVYEVLQSLDILEKIMEGLPEGPITFEPKVNKLLTVLKKAEGVGYGCIEAPRGDDTHAVGLKAQQENVQWWKVRAPTYSNAVSWPLMFKDNELADAPLIINSIDPCISCMERMVLSDTSSGTKSVVTKADLLKLCREKTDKTRRLMGA